MEQEQILNSLNTKEKIEILKKMLNDKKYDFVYQYFGKNIYHLVTPKEHKKNDIKKLMEEKEYGQIYNKYGKVQTFFVKDLRKKKKEDIKKSIDVGDFESIYSKYGEKEYNNHIKKMGIKDIRQEAGDISKFKLYKSKHKLVSGLKNLKYIVAAILAANIYYVAENAYSYNKMLEPAEYFLSGFIYEYNNHIQDYAKKINELNLNDFQIIMKVMDDKWNDMKGYGNPEYDVFGYWRLDMMPEYGVGVCRQIADDYTATLNAIKPEYNARNVVVYFEPEYYTNESFANIQTKYADNYVSEEVEEQEDTYFDKIYGNHMATLVDLPNENVTLLVCPTNGLIGILKNGKIVILSTKTGKGMIYARLGQFETQSFEDYLSVGISFVKSFSNFTSNEEAKEKWGIDAQNEALEYGRTEASRKK